MCDEKNKKENIKITEKISDKQNPGDKSDKREKHPFVPDPPVPNRAHTGI